MTTNEKPVCQLSGTDGNVFALAGRVARALKAAGRESQVQDLWDRLVTCGSFDDALGLFTEYVEVR
jgi:hypothetical protein